MKKLYVKPGGMYCNHRAFKFQLIYIILSITELVIKESFLDIILTLYSSVSTACTTSFSIQNSAFYPQITFVGSI